MKLCARAALEAEKKVKFYKDNDLNLKYIPASICSWDTLPWHPNAMLSLMLPEKSAGSCPTIPNYYQVLDLFNNDK